ncbi:MAG: transglutaminase-like domain-containing protein [Bacteroidales bacterium]
MEKKKIQALIHLLDDPDTEISDVVTGNLRELGTDIIPELESAWEKTADHHYQERIENIIQDIQFRNVKGNLAGWKESGASDLLEGVCWIARYRYPDLEPDDIRSEIKKISADIWLELNNKLTALEKVRIINHIIFDIHRFSKNRKNIYSPRNSFINLVMESKKGNPISLAVIYLLVAENLNLPVYGVDLPRIFILAYMDDQPPVKKKTGNREVLFYINPYQKGAVLGKREINNFLAEQKLEPRDSFYNPCSNIDIVRRLLLNLILSYEKAGYRERLTDLQELLKLFTP